MPVSSRLFELSTKHFADTCNYYAIMHSHSYSTVKNLKAKLSNQHRSLQTYFYIIDKIQPKIFVKLIIDMHFYPAANGGHMKIEICVMSILNLKISSL